MARVLKGSHSFICTPRVHPLSEWTIPAFAFPAEAGTHLPTPEGWKAELVTYWNWYPAPGIEPDTVTHLSTNRARRRLTSLIKANVLTTTPDHQRHMPFSLSCWKLNDHFYQQSSLFQFVKSLLAVDLQLSDVPCHTQGDVAHDVSNSDYHAIFNQLMQILHWLDSDLFWAFLWKPRESTANGCRTVH